MCCEHRLFDTSASINTEDKISVLSTNTQVILHYFDHSGVYATPVIHN